MIGRFGRGWRRSIFDIVDHCTAFLKKRENIGMFGHWPRLVLVVCAIPQLFLFSQENSTATRSRDQLSQGVRNFLLAHSEPPDLGAQCENICFRLIRRSNPSARTLILRLETGRDGTAKVSAKIFDGINDVILNRTDSVSASDVRGFLSVVKQGNFWQLPTTEVQEGPPIQDGNYWIIEGLQAGTYHLVRRRHPKPSPYTEIGRYLGKKLAGLDDSVFFVPAYPSSR
jgi:hypothetical protein